jgi:hypothetical protein
MHVIWALLVTGISTSHVDRSAAQTNVHEMFNQHPLSDQTWNFCQTAHDLNSPRPGEDGNADSAYGFGVDDVLPEPGCDCQTRADCALMAATDAESIDFETDGEPRLYPAPAAPNAMDAMDPCSGYDPSRIPNKKKLQKNELRLWMEDWPQAGDGYWFSFRFKIEGDIDRCGSMRWVGGQFKAHGKDDSPFVAQRFDNGVFHITIEGPRASDGRSDRVMVAQAPGFPDLGSGLQPCKEGEICGETVTCDMSSGTPVPVDCGISGRVTSLGGMLPSIDGGRWIQMDYYLRIAGACDVAHPEDCERMLEVWADGNPIVRVEGRFGVDEAHAGPLNFKVGVYRDRQAGTAGLVIDDFETRYDPHKTWSPEQK